MYDPNFLYDYESVNARLVTSTATILGGALMLKRLFESITTLTGSKRSDAQFDANSIANRSIIGRNLTNDELFTSPATLAVEIYDLLKSPQHIADDQMSSIIDKLKSIRDELNILEARFGVANRVSEACLALNTGALDVGSGIANGDATSEEVDWRKMIRMVLAARDTGNKLWADAEVLAAQSLFGLNGVPSYEFLCLRFGESKVEKTLQELINERVAWLQFQAVLQGNNAPCHICGIAAKLSYHEFGLLRLLSKERDWTMTAASVAISGLTLPFLGYGQVRGPDATKKGNILRMRLVVCESCLKKRQISTSKLTIADYSKHPFWSEAHNAGFDTFIEGSDLSAWR